MRSRSCYAIAASSFLLLWTACPAGDTKSDGDDRKAMSAKADEKAEDKADETKDAADSGSVEAAEADSGEPVPEDDDTGDEGGEGAEPGATSGRKHDCEPGWMPFEGECTPKERVAKIVDQREEEALMRVQTAKKPDQTAEAVHDLLEQQIYQVDKAEDDLDEIIEQLRREQDEKKRPDEGDKKGGRG